MAGPIRIAILANGSQARREIGQVQGSLGRLSGVAKGAALVGFGALTAGAAAFVKGSIDVERQFSTSMRLIKDSTGAPAAEMEKLNRLAIKLGQDTSFSAGEAADAMLELAKAGLDTKTIMGGGLSGTLTLAAAGGTDLATASTIASNALKTFNLQGKDMKVVAAALAGGANASTASVESLGQALQQVGPGATNAGLSLQETVAALSAFDAAGIKGSDAGTSLKTMLTRLVPSTKAARMAMDEYNLSFTNADGSFKSLTQISGQLQRSLGKLSDEQRVQALTAIFGSDATRAASVLMKEGAKGIRAYIKATKDQAAAQKLATARMSGTEGALEKLSGSMETAKLRLGQEFAPAIVAGADALDDKLVPALESGIKAGRKIASALAPAVSEIADALGNLAGEGDAAGRVFDEVLIPTLTAASEIVGGLVDFFDDLPGPVKEIGVQAGIAALVFPRLTASVTGATAAVTLQIARLQQLRAEMTYTATRAQLTTAAMAKFGAAAKATAGIGGMLLLTQGMQQSNGAAKAMLTTLGGAATGFAFAGPAGAAVGGLAGLMIGLSDGTNRADEVARNSITTWQTYATTLDDVTGATTRATKSMIVQELQQNGLLKKAGELGVSKSTLVNGILGQKSAHETLTKAIKDEEQGIRDAAAAYNEKYDSSIKRGSDEAKAAYDAIQARRANLKAIQDEVGEVRKSTQVKREELLVLQSFPDAVITKVQTPGAVDSKRELAELVATYKLTPKQIATVIKMNGIKTSKDEVISLSKEIVKSGTAKPSNAWSRFFSADLGKTKRDADAGTNDLNSLLSAAGNVKPKIRHGAFGQGLAGDLSQLKILASGGGTGVGTNLGSGMYFGLGQWINPISQRAASMVRGAVSAANAAGAINSPSRETMKTGSGLGEGLVVGMARQQPAVRAAARGLVSAVLAGVDDGRSGVDASLDKITAQIRRSITGKGDEKRESALLKRLADRYKLLRLNGSAQDKLNDKLESSRDRLKELKQEFDDYAKSIKDAITATGDVAQLGKQDDGTVSITSLLNELETKALRAERFANLIQKLQGDGLSRTAIQQMLDAGPEAALATAEAIAFGGASAITEINALQTRLAATGTQLGSAMADTYYGAGVNAAQGLVRGLEAEAARLDRAAVNLANALVAAVKRALGIRSPSKVFAGIGDNVIKGLDIGLDDTYVKRSGAVMAASLQKGFGTPALTAYTAAQAAAGASTSTVRVRFSAQQISQLQRGREIQADLDFARGVGTFGETL